MRELKIVGLDADSKYLICESDGLGERFKLAADDQLRDLLRGEVTPPEQPHLDMEVTNMLSPKEIQAKIRAGASVEQVAAASGSDLSRIRRFAHPVLLERYRAAELATAAHPMLADGPAVMTLLETVSAAMVARGLDPSGLSWDAWRNEDNRWTVQLAWKVGRSDNLAHFFFVPGAHGGTVTAVDDAASELIDPDFERPLRPLARVAHVEFEEPEPVAPTPDPPVHSRRGKPVIPAWEDVLLGVRSGGQR
ncbi:MAG: septation protein SepH [Actinomycetota bacterium]|uniref:Septation protein SepH n=1 Tax=Mycobacterium lentiflavum TaxID=141349 RepID=A0ABY3UQ29_MYCLN|nr:septation protein SepH [Mycobacterium lentiflavum]MEE3063387.1 septation protein SepH [Actinomycetota bacterium]ULP41706.1 septation protein SepH [Mycobacterium lentiflavum]